MTHSADCAKLISREFDRFITTFKLQVGPHLSVLIYQCALVPPSTKVRKVGPLLMHILLPKTSSTLLNQPFLRPLILGPTALSDIRPSLRSQPTSLLLQMDPGIDRDRQPRSTSAVYRVVTQHHPTGQDCAGSFSRGPVSTVEHAR